jgi:hypothetical protein
MRNGLIPKILLTACLAALTLTGCGSRAQKAAEKLLSRKEQAIQVIDKVKSEKQLGLVEYEVQKIVKAKEEDHKFFFIQSKKEILCSCKAYLKAGIDLGGFNPMTDVSVDPDETMITITLPAPTLLSLNMPINGVEILYEKTQNSQGFILSELNDLLRQGEKQILDSVPDLGIMEDAKQNARLFFEPLFKRLGFTSVQVDFKGDNK